MAKNSKPNMQFMLVQNVSARDGRTSICEGKRLKAKNILDAQEETRRVVTSRGDYKGNLKLEFEFSCILAR
jgi:hypothetical protein